MWIQIFSLILLFSLFEAKEPVLPDLPEDFQKQNPPDVPKADEDPDLQYAREELLKKFFDEWLIHMKDFDPTKMVTFEIPASDKKIFFEEVNIAPQQLRGAYTVSAKLKNKIKFIVYDPDNIPIISRENQREAIFHMQVNKTGKYSFTFLNKNVFFMRNFNFLIVSFF